MRAVTFNIQYGLGRDGRTDLARTAAAVRGADVIALQEVERHWQRSGMVDQVAALAAHLPAYHWVYGANLDIDASTTAADGTVVNRRRQFGNMLLARRPIGSSRNFLLPKWGAVDQFSLQRGLLEGVVETAIGPVRFYSLHLSHLASAARLPEVQAVLDILARSHGEGGAWCGRHPDPDSGWPEGGEPSMPRLSVVMGDLNTATDAPEYALLVGPPTARFGRLTRRDGLLDSWVLAGHAEDTGDTRPPDPGKATRLSSRIDYCLVHAELGDRVRAAWIDTDCVASDHQPYWVEMEL